MLRRIVMSETALRAIADTAIRSFPAGLCRGSIFESILIHSPVVHPSNSLRLGVAVAETSSALVTAYRDLISTRTSNDVAFLAVGNGPAAGRIAGSVVVNGQVQSVDDIQLVTPGMPIVHLSPWDATRRPSFQETWSRSIGALSEARWRQLVSLHYAVVGCGRTGSIVVDSLARLGIQQLSIIDPDRLERHNLGEMAIAHAEIDRHKAEAVANRISQDMSYELQPICESIFSLSSLLAIKEADVVICCVDNAAARLGVDFLAKLYIKPLLDIGTGILRLAGRPNRIGADIRFLLPGRCLSCFGGVAQRDEGSFEILRHASQTVLELNTPDWQSQRAGSLRSLNLTAVGCGLRLLEDFLGGTLRESAWIHLEWDGMGHPQLEHRDPSVRRDCTFCGVTGLGDEGLALLPSVIGS